MNDFKKSVFLKNMYLALEKFLVEAVSELTPVRTGHTAGSWEIQLKDDGFYLVNTNGLIAKYLEEGTKPHIIKPKSAKALKFKGKNGITFAKVVKHPGFEGRWMVKKTLEDKNMWSKIDKFMQSKLTTVD